MNNRQSGDFVSGLQDAIRQNPVSAALVGMGILWMFAGGNRITAAAALLPSAARAAAAGVGSGLTEFRGRGRRGGRKCALCRRPGC